MNLNLNDKLTYIRNLFSFNRKDIERKQLNKIYVINLLYKFGHYGAASKLRSHKWWSQVRENYRRDFKEMDYSNCETDDQLMQTALKNLKDAVTLNTVFIYNMSPEGWQYWKDINDTIKHEYAEEVDKKFTKMYSNKKPNNV